MQCTIYNESGEILRLVDCPEDHVALQAQEGEFVIDGWHDMATKIIVNGVVTDKPEEEEISDEHKNMIVLTKLREYRDMALASSDWTQVADAPISDEEKAAWASYRQELRDLPNTYANETNIDSVIYPEPPTE